MLVIMPLVVIVVTLFLIGHAVFFSKEINKIDLNKLYSMYSEELDKTNKEVKDEDKSIAKLKREIKNELKKKDNLLNS